MKQSFLVQGLGYWGRGKTMKEAAQEVRKAGAGRHEYVQVDLYVHPTEDPKPSVINGGMNVEFHEGSTRIPIGKSISLSALLNSEPIEE